LRTQSLVLLVLAAALVASVWVNPVASTAVRYNQQAAAAALSIYATLRTVSATLSVLKDADVEGSVLFGSVAASPGQVLEPVTHTIERFSDIMFVVALVSGLLALVLAPAASVGAVVAAVGLALAAAVVAARREREVPPGLARLGRAAVVLGLALALFLPTVYGLAFRLGDGLTRAAEADARAVLARLSTGSPDLAAGEAEGIAGLRARLGELVTGEAVARFMTAADDLLRASVDLSLAYLLKLVVLPVLLALGLWWLARATPLNARTP
jgi:hypothetical protein